MRLGSFLSVLFGLLSFSAIAVEVPGGLIRTAEGTKAETYELVLSPVYVMSPSGAYLSSELRYQTNEDFAVGFGFGAGEIGFNFGVNGTWHILPDLDRQPAVGVMGGLYFNRIKPDNHFVFKIAPVVSKTVKVDFGAITPYAGLHISPSFRLNTPSNELSLKTSLGCAFLVEALQGSRLWTEVDLGVANSVHELVVGITYPLP